MEVQQPEGQATRLRKTCASQGRLQLSLPANWPGFSFFFHSGSGLSGFFFGGGAPPYMLPIP